MIAALILFHPEFAVGTLLELGSFDKHHEFFIIILQVGHLFVLGTGKIDMELAFAGKAVMILAGRTLVVGQGCIKGKNCTAARSGTPAGIVHVLLNVVVKSKVFVLLPQISREVLTDLFRSNLSFAMFLGAVEGDYFIDDLFF